METSIADAAAPAGATRGARAGVGGAPAAVAVAAGVALARAVPPFMGVEAALAALLAALILAPLVVRWATRKFDLFEPAVIVSAVYFVYFVVGPLARIVTADTSFLGRDFAQEYLAALAATAVAVCAMWLGYAMPVGPAPCAAAPFTAADARRGRTYGLALLVLAVCGMVLWAKVAGRSLLTFLLPGLLGGGGGGEGPDIPYFFLAIEWFVPATTVLIAMGALRSRGARWALIGAVTVVYVSIGFRYRIVMLWGATAIVGYLRAGRRPRLRFLVAPGVTLFLFAGWLASARAFFRTGGQYGTLRFDLKRSVLEALADTRIFDTLGAVMDVVPRFVPYVGALPFVYPFILPIPRILWPGKPLPEQLATVGASIGTPESAGAGPAVPHFGEYYLAFGWPGIAIGAFLFGAANKWLWRWYRAAPDDPWRQAIFALNASMIFQAIIRGYLAQIIQEWCFIVLPAVVISWLARGRAAAAAGARA